MFDAGIMTIHLEMDFMTVIPPGETMDLLQENMVCFVNCKFCCYTTTVHVVRFCFCKIICEIVYCSTYVEYLYYYMIARNGQRLNIFDAFESGC